MSVHLVSEETQDIPALHPPAAAALRLLPAVEGAQQGDLGPGRRVTAEDPGVVDEVRRVASDPAAVLAGVGGRHRADPDPLPALGDHRERVCLVKAGQGVQADHHRLAGEPDAEAPASEGRADRRTTCPTRR